MKKWRKLFAAALMTSVFVCGCSQKNQTEIKRHEETVEISFSWWGNDERHEYTTAAIKKFERLNPKIKVSMKYGDWTGFLERTNIERAAKTEADVMQMNYGWLKKFSPDGNGFYDLFLGRSRIGLTNFTSEEKALGIIDGKLNGLPVAINAPVFYWNKSLFDSYGLKLPERWEDLFEAAEEMKADGVCPLYCTDKFAWILCTAYVEQKTGRRMIEEDGALGFTQEDFEDMLAFYSKLIQEEAMCPTAQFERSYLSDGQYAGALAWISDAGNYCDDAAAKGFEMMVGDFLADEDAKRLGWYMKPAVLYSISANTPHPKEAAQLVEFLLNSKEMALEQKLEKGVPVSDAAQKVLKENDLLKGLTYDGYTKMNESIEDIELISPYFEEEVLIEAFTDAADEVIAQEKNCSAAAEELYEKIQEILIEKA